MTNITLRQAEGTWVVRAGGAVLAESSDAVEVTEAGRDPVIYFPRDGIAMPVLEQTETTTTCPTKGVATYFAIHAKSYEIDDAAWTYETPNEGMERLAGLIAFDADKVTVERL